MKECQPIFGSRLVSRVAILSKGFTCFVAASERENRRDVLHLIMAVPRTSFSEVSR
jgi:hypothetical protein